MNDNATARAKQDQVPIESTEDLYAPGTSSQERRLTEQTALEGLLASCGGVESPRGLAKELLRHFGGLDGVLRANHEQFLAIGVTQGLANLLGIVDWIRQQIPKDHPQVIPDKRPDSKNESAENQIERSKPNWLLDNRPMPHVQAEMPLTLSGQSELSFAHKSPARERKTIQDVLIPEGLLALRIAVEVRSMEELQDVLIKRLGQNSVETRRRYSQSIVKWFFQDGLNGLLPRVWWAYGDDAIASDLLRWTYLDQEPIMGRCVAEALFPCENGLVIPATYFDKFLQDLLGEAPPDKTRERLKINLKKIGFLERLKSKPDKLLPVMAQKTSFLILLHHLFAAKSVRTVELRNLFVNPFWKYLGYKSEDAVRAVLREADASGLIGKYVVADQLEQVTTCFSLDEFIERRARL